MWSMQMFLFYVNMNVIFVAYLVLGIDHGAVKAPPIGLQVSSPELLHQHSP